MRRLFFVTLYRRMFVARFMGYGFCLCSLAANLPMFSERFDYVPFIDLFGWRLRALDPIPWNG